MAGSEHDSRLLKGALKITVISVTVSVLITIVAMYALSADLAEMARGMRFALPISIAAPTLIAFPIGYVTLMQRIRLADANQRLEFLLKYDRLTALYSREHFFSKLAVEMEASAARGEDYAICYIDLDHFGTINNRFGHQTGDEVLRLFGFLVTSFVRPGEFAGRVGGEEFCLFLPDISENKARLRAQQLLNEFKLSARQVNGKTLEATLSIGIAISNDASNVDRVVNEADRYVYQAKIHGRNRVVMKEDGLATSAPGSTDPNVIELPGRDLPEATPMRAPRL